jgi:hypothetical protein|tara:strand:- start:143 stop:616 length:474 start_codon:yes stop_codon:yes gene_type:complete
MKKETKVYSGSLEIRERCKTPEDRRSLLNLESIDSRLLKDLRSVEPYGNEPISIDSKTYKVCYNRGNARIWIEGKRLIDNGIYNGLKFVKSVNEYGIILKFLPAEYEGKSHKVAGSVERPIIDLNGKYLTKFFGDAENYKVTFWKGLNLHYILIEKA